MDKGGRNEQHWWKQESKQFCNDRGGSVRGQSRGCAGLWIWQAVNLLISLTSALLNNGQPLLILPNLEHSEDNYSKNKYHNILLQAISTLVIQNSEVVSTMGTTANMNEPVNPGPGLHPSCHWPALHEVEWKDSILNQGILLLEIGCSGLYRGVYLTWTGMV